MNYIKWFQQKKSAFFKILGFISLPPNYISRDPGTLYHTKGKSDQYDMFSGGCVLIDHSIGCGRIKHQVYINSTETFKAKLTFEREAQSQGVVIKEYHTDNGIFNASKFMDELQG